MFTATESAVIADIIAIIVGAFMYRELNLSKFLSVMANIAITTAVFTLFITIGKVFGLVLTYEQIPRTIANGIVNLSENLLEFIMN